MTQKEAINIHMGNPWTEDGGTSNMLGTNMGQTMGMTWQVKVEKVLMVTAWLGMVLHQTTGMMVMMMTCNLWSSSLH